MGMYDWLVCKYPVWLPEWSTKFQTKDLGCSLDTYVIEADGRLTCDGILVEFTGAVNFYDNNVVGRGPGVYTRNGEDAEEVEYCARFAEGLLESGITLIKHEKSLAAKMKPLRSSTPLSAERFAEPLLGRTIHVWWGGQESGYDAVVKAENAVQLVVEKPGARFEVIWRASRDSTFFDSREDGMMYQVERKAEWERLRAEYEREISEKKAIRGEDKDV